MIFDKRILNGGLWVFAGKFITGVAQILIAMLLTRMLSPEDFGLFQVIQRALLFMGIIASFGMAWVIVRRVAEGLAIGQPERSVAYAKNIFYIVMGITTLLAGPLFFFGSYMLSAIFNVDLSGLNVCLAGLLFCVSFQQVIPEAFRGLHDMKLASVFSGAATNTLLLLFIYFWLDNQANFSDVLNIYFFATFSVVVMSGSTLFRRLLSMGKISFLVDQKAMLKENLKVGFPLTLTAVLSFFVSQADIWIVAVLFSVEEAAYYTAASRLVFVVSAPVMVANGATRGMVADLWARGDVQKLQGLLRSVASLTLLAALIPALAFLFWGADILEVLFGSFYQQAAGILGFLVIGQLVLLAAGPAATLMIFSGHQKQVLYFDIASAAVFLFSVFFLNGFYGPVGVAVASSLAISVKVLLSSYYSQRYLNITTYAGELSFFRGST